MIELDVVTMNRHHHGGNKEYKDIPNLLHQLLSDHTSRSEHRKTSILQLLRLHDGKFLGILGFQAEGIESDIARVMVIVQVLEAEGSFRRDESIQSAVDLKATNEDSEGNQAPWRDGINLIKVTDGRSDILVVGLELYKVTTKYVREHGVLLISS